MVGNINLAVPPLRQAAELFAKLGDAESEAISLQALATLHDSSGQCEDADRCRDKADTLVRESSQFAYRAKPAPGENLTMVEQRDRCIRDERLQAGEMQAVIHLSDNMLEIVKTRGGIAPYISGLELVVAFGEQI